RRRGAGRRLRALGRRDLQRGPARAAPGRRRRRGQPGHAPPRRPPRAGGWRKSGAPPVDPRERHHAIVAAMRRALFLVCALAVGCQKAGAPPKVDLPLLAHVPADTPYLYAMLEPVPRSTWERFAPIVGDIEKLLKKSPPEDPVAKAILQELGGNLSWAGLRKLTGLD